MLHLFDTLSVAGRTIVVITHEDEVAAHAKRVLRMRDGLIESDVRQAPGRGAAAALPRTGSRVNLTESLRFAWRGVTANKGRSLLTMLGVLIGVASVIALVAVGNGASATVTNTLNSLGSNTLTVVPGTSSGGVFGGGGGWWRRRWREGWAAVVAGAVGAGTAGAATAARRNGSRRTATTAPARSSAENGTDIRAVQLTLDDAAALADKSQAPDVLGVAPVVSVSSATATYRGASHSVGSLTGTTPSYLLINNDTVATGHAFSDSDYLAHSRVALIGPTVAKALVGGDGSAILGRTINLNGNGFTVIGILTAKGSPARRTRTTGSSPRRRRSRTPWPAPGPELHLDQGHLRGHGRRRPGRGRTDPGRPARHHRRPTAGSRSPTPPRSSTRSARSPRPSPCCSGRSPGSPCSWAVSA